jgi:hypothetical protein
VLDLFVKSTHTTLEKEHTNNNISEEKVTKIVADKLKHAVPAALEC